MAAAAAAAAAAADRELVEMAAPEEEVLHPPADVTLAAPPMEAMVMQATTVEKGIAVITEEVAVEEVYQLEPIQVAGTVATEEADMTTAPTISAPPPGCRTPDSLQEVAAAAFTTLVVSEPVVMVEVAMVADLLMVVLPQPIPAAAAAAPAKTWPLIMEVQAPLALS